MQPDDFEALYDELHVGETDPRASEETCTASLSNSEHVVTGNASRMGAIEGRVKLAICLRILFGQFKRKVTFHNDSYCWTQANR